MTSLSRKRITSLVTKMFLVVSLLFGVVAFTGETAQAQRGRSFDRQGGRHYPGVFTYGRRYPRRFWGSRWNWYGTYPYGFNSYYYFPSTHVSEGQGYRDGLHDGKDDAKDAKAYDPYRHQDYKDAITSAYTSGYLRGYAEGYRHTPADE